MDVRHLGTFPVTVPALIFTISLCYSRYHYVVNIAYMASSKIIQSMLMNCFIQLSSLFYYHSRFLLSYNYHAKRF